MSMLKLSIITFSMNPHLEGAFLKLWLRGLKEQEETGMIGIFSQLQSSIMYPSGSWKNTWSTLIPSSSTTAVTYLIPFSSNLFFTSSTSVHCPKPNCKKISSKHSNHEYPYPCGHSIKDRDSHAISTKPFLLSGPGHL